MSPRLNQIGLRVGACFCAIGVAAGLAATPGEGSGKLNLPVVFCSAFGIAVCAPKQALGACRRALQQCLSRASQACLLVGHWPRLGMVLPLGAPLIAQGWRTDSFFAWCCSAATDALGDGALAVFFFSLTPPRTGRQFQKWTGGPPTPLGLCIGLTGKNVGSVGSPMEMGPPCFFQFSGEKNPARNSEGPCPVSKKEWGPPQLFVDDFWFWVSVGERGDFFFPPPSPFFP